MRWNRIDEHVVDDVVVLDLCDPQGLQTDSEERLVRRVRQLLSNGRAKIVINLHELRHIDADGLGQIVNAYKTAREAEASVKLCGVTPQLRDLLKETRLDSFLEVFDSEQDAVQSFSTRF
jgi:anti-anti-sigma factor